MGKCLDNESGMVGGKVLGIVQDKENQKPPNYLVFPKDNPAVEGVYYDLPVRPPGSGKRNQ
ncbi:MAG: hypothetical protein HPY68_01780 [Candidatus Atribacteria bacterium]|nr:hypothetical protein [Candidatus Atribacteria bacterium]